jgi:type III secretory pathway component EscS
MIPVNDLFELTKEGLLLAVLLCLPVAGAVALSSIISSIVQMLTKISEPSFSQILRIGCGTVAFIITAPWIASRAMHFAERAWSLVQMIHP